MSRMFERPLQEEFPHIFIQNKAGMSSKGSQLAGTLVMALSVRPPKALHNLSLW